MPARAPSLALVLLPCLVLALLGLRAVQVEVDAAELRNRRSAEAAAARLGRSLNRLIAEHRDALPRPDTTVAADDLTRLGEHLEPRWLLELPPEEPAAADPEWAPLIEEVEARVDALLADGETELASALLGASAVAIADPTSRAVLLRRALGLAQDPERRAEEAARLLVALSRADAVTAEDVIDGLEALAAVDWARPGESELSSTVLAWSYRLAARDLDRERRLRATVVLDELERILPVELSVGDRVVRQVVAQTGGDAQARGPWAVDTEVEPLVVVATSVRTESGGRTLRMLGAVPPARLDAHLRDEARELVAEGAVESLTVTNADGLIVGAVGEERSRDAVTVTLDGALGGWRIDAVPVPADGIPPLAWMLGLATVVTTTALVVGVLALRRTALEQIQLAEDRRRFLDHVAHEVRTPATSLLALSDELVAGHVSPERRATYDALLQSEAQRLSDLVEETLDLSRLESGRLRFERREADVAALIRQAAERSLDPASIGVEVELPDAPVAAQVDARAIVRTVRNLIENALSHSGTDQPVEVSLAESGADVVVRVTDRGGGIAPEHVERVFERFYRVPSETHEGKGVGLGLVLCREVAHAHGGTLTCESEVGRGTTFTLTLPRTSEERT